MKIEFSTFKLFFRSFNFRFGFFTTFYVGIDLLFIIFTQMQLLNSLHSIKPLSKDGYNIVVVRIPV
jgi:hypothetical protein